MPKFRLQVMRIGLRAKFDDLRLSLLLFFRFLALLSNATARNP